MRHFIKKNLGEQIVISVSILKWVFLASIVGIIVGLIATGFLKVIHYIPHMTQEYNYTLYFLPLILFIISLLNYYIPVTEGIGTNRLIKAIHDKFGRINIKIIPLRVIYSFLILFTGGSAGKESPCAQIGAGVSSGVADLFRLDNIDHQKLVVCGMCAGFATVFGTPIAGAIFGVELLIVGTIKYEFLLPSLISTITAYHISSYLGITYFYHPVNVEPVFNEWFFLTVVLAGLFFGICSHIYLSLLDLSKKILQKLNLWFPLKALLAGLILVGLTFVFSKEYLGLGLETITASLNGEPVLWYAFLVKSIFTALTLGVTSNSSVITPIFFIGVTSGSAFASMLDVDQGTFAAIGFVSLLAGCANTPVSTSIMAIELFGADIAPYAAVGCVISFLMTGHRSLYSSQILAFSKSRSLVVEVGKELKNTESELKLRHKSILIMIREGLRIIIERIKNI